MSTYKRSALHLYDSADPTKEFSVTNSSGVVTLVVDASQYLTVSGNATFLGSTTSVKRAAPDGTLNDFTLEDTFDGLDLATATNAASIAAETVRATAQEVVLDDKIDAAVAALEATDAANLSTALTAVSTEQTRATTAEAGLQTNISNEATRATAAETAINAAIASLTATEAANHTTSTDAIAAEAARALAAEAAIQADVDANETAAAAALSAAETALQTSIDGNSAALTAEVARATAAEAGLQSQLTDIVSNVDPAALDSLSEVVSHFNAADSNASNLLGLLITRVTAIQSVIDTLVDPDLPALDALLTAAAV